LRDFSICGFGAVGFPEAVGKPFGFFAQEVVGFDDAEIFVP
jgi:hypothetical protein